MGRPKALLPLGGRSFLRRAVEALRGGGCDPVLVVLRAGAHEEAQEAESAGGPPILNPDPDSQQIDSLRLALAALPGGVSAAVVLPVDHPLVTAETVRALVRAFGAGGPRIVRAAYAGRPGHPTLFARDLFPELLSAGLPDGARSVIAAHAGGIVDVAVADAGVAWNVDTPADHERALAFIERQQARP